METKERGRYTRQGTNQKGMGWSQEGIDRYNELFKEKVLNQKESWANDFEMHQSPGYFDPRFLC
jgi:hypothetical protein